jgi:hypothetical protein
MRDLYDRIATNRPVEEYELVHFLQKENGIIERSVCKDCCVPLALIRAPGVVDCFIWRCNGCKRTHCVRDGSIFKRSKLSLKQLLFLLYHFCNEIPVVDVRYLTGISNNTIVVWNRVFREACAKYLAHNCRLLGINTSVVQIDETLIARRKYNHGRMIREQWLFGAIDSVKNHFILRNITRRTKEELRRVIMDTISEEALVVSDMLSAYMFLFTNDLPQLHLTVNHSTNFVDPETDAHTNSIENFLMRLKQGLRRRYQRSREHLGSYLDEFCFRARFKREDKFNMFCEIIRSINK